MTPAGGVKCWGEWTGYGDGFTYTTVPEAVTGLDSGVVAIGGGPYHTCAILSTGAPRCWGWNQYGDLGNGVSGSVNTPIHVEVSGLGSGVIAIVGGQMHSCALTAVRGVKCWGRNNHGQLGDGSTTDSLVPVDVTGLESGVIAIRGAPLHTCVLTSSGGVKCWGLNWEGRLGNGSTTDSPVPVDVLGLKAGVIALGTGWRHTCAITKAGVKCWGSNDFGELGDGTTMDSSVPVDVSGLDSAVIAIRGGIDHTCALTASGGIQCWGNNFDGQLGNDSIETSSAPVHVKGLDSGEVAVAAGMSHTCALASTGGVQCWGENFRGQLGNNSTKGSLAPVNVVGF
jgi:alpha-tubulin suppressor-like RCC1 family protein